MAKGTRLGIFRILYFLGIFRNITHSNRLDLVAQLAEHWTSKPKVMSLIPAMVGKIFSLPSVDKLREHHMGTINTTKHHMNLIALICVNIVKYHTL